MAVKFKSKYTAQQIENILDQIDATSKGAFIQVDELPNAKDANTSIFYICDDRIYYIDATTREWKELEASGIGGGGEIIPTDKFEHNQLNFFDFQPVETPLFQPLQVGDKMPIVFTRDMVQNPSVVSSDYFIGSPTTNDGMFYFDLNNQNSLCGWCGDVISTTGQEDVSTNTVTLDTSKYPELLTYVIKEIVKGDGDIGYTLTNAVDYFTVKDSETLSFLNELIEVMQNKGVSYYTLTDVKGAGWIDGFDENNLTQVQASFAEDANKQYVFIMLTLVNGSQVRLTRDSKYPSLWTIEYIGYAL